MFAARPTKDRSKPSTYGKMKFSTLFTSLLLLPLSVLAETSKEPDADEPTIEQLQQRVAELEKLLEEKDETLAKVAGQLKIGAVALNYLEKEGWKPVIIGPVRRVKMHEYDELGTEVIVIGNVGILNETKLYEEGIMGSFMFLNEGVSLGKEEFFSLHVIDSLGSVQELSEVD